MGGGDFGSFMERGGLGGAVFSRSWTGQSKATKDAQNEAIRQQEALLKAAQEKSDAEEATSQSAISRARQKALASATAATGRKSTIKTQGVAIGASTGTEKTLIGE